ncbi:hypothetical protein A3E66_04850 [Candidatus Daviesbacteria bacterium RIFCSPHIGHO2_12_FULL_37_16]|uniref:Type II secretion system protein G n=3 Tax=Candidatus Daviesiibacteriota TaxID=1752718 RepID=A0A0G0F6D2_9BACT|nr:MAG: Type II secretion system protein G [Candidatus Daviesbacteria bacterium GW2011_GWB1_36_5]KKQ16115.1 MAG: Type II secretion system protein G [Candidatus Daviesbacteria bacterium GW2011_GWA1_36_8]OGE34590.1 MAG: hypothetical protein A3E66_04850 [Candidatus Daviesbacteria bacterium RIFCSPHIGHO2_12_FULL_37_16]
MMIKLNSNKGFTLIELLVAISIIAIISAVGFTSFNAAQIRGRDAKRKQDLRAISVALEIYRQKNGRYPCTNDLVNQGWQNSTNSSASFWLTDAARVDFPFCGSAAFNTNYINQLPIDPSNNSGSTAWDGAYGYSYFSRGDCASPYNIPGNWYYLVTRLENAQDPDAKASQNLKKCDGNIVDRGYPGVFVIIGGL